MVVAQFGGAHGGTPGAGRHDAPPIFRKKDGIDQLGFATRELCHKGHHDLVAAHLILQALQTLLDGGIHQILARQPLRQLLELLRKSTPPRTMLAKLLVK